MVHGPATGLLELELVADEPALVGHHRRATLLTRSDPERPYLETRTTALHR